MSKIVNFRVSKNEYLKLKKECGKTSLSEHLRKELILRKKVGKFFLVKKISTYLMISFFLFSTAFVGAFFLFSQQFSEIIERDKKITERENRLRVLFKYSKENEMDNFCTFIKIREFNEDLKTNPIGFVYRKHSKDTLKLYISTRRIGRYGFEEE